LSTEPFEVTHKRWRHIESGYIVAVLGVYHASGPNLVYSTVKVRGTRLSRTRIATWSAACFVKTFRPIGRKFQLKSSWERLLDLEDS
jgi:hypothetical protein